MTAKGESGTRVYMYMYIINVGSEERLPSEQLKKLNEVELENLRFHAKSNRDEEVNKKLIYDIIPKHLQLHMKVT